MNVGSFDARSTQLPNTPLSYLDTNYYRLMKIDEMIDEDWRPQIVDK